MGRPAGILVRCTCTCGAVEMHKGCNDRFRCASCNPNPRRLRVEYQAHQAVAAAIRRGELRPVSECVCVDCGGPAEHYDHRDYFKPLAVDPVCRRCNFRRGPALGVDQLAQQ